MSYFVNNLLYDPCTSGSFHLWSRIYKLTLSSPEHAPAYMMAANAGVIKAIVSFYHVNSDTAFERHRSWVLSKPDRKSDKFAITKDGQWKLELSSMPAGWLRQVKWTVCILIRACVSLSCSGVNISMQVSPENHLCTATLSRFRNIFALVFT